MISLIRNTAAAMTAAALLAACSSHGSPGAAHTTSAVPATPAAAGPAQFTCADLGAVLPVLVADQRNQDRTFQEKWVMGNDGPDLHEAISVTKSASQAAPAGQVTAAAAQFYSDATSYLSGYDVGGYLAPGWRGPYRTVRRDILRLAVACHIPHSKF